MKIPYKMAKVRRAEKKKKFTVLSTFAGGGGSSTGYRLAGGDILAINEFIPEACETYAKNYPTTKIFQGDIRELKGEDVLKELGIKKGELDILDGSPPCSAFSMAGSREKGWGKIKKYSSTKQRVDDLFFEYARLVKDLQPKVFIAENVKALTIGGAKGVLGSLHKGFNLLDNEKDQILPVLTDAGYTVRYKVLNSVDFGVPQFRERTIIIGVRNDIGIVPTFPEPLETPRMNIGPVFAKIPRDDDMFQVQLAGNVGFSWLEKLKPGQKVSHIHPRKHFFNYMRLANDEPCYTICQSSNKHYMHPDGKRYISINECKSIMGFPQDYILTGNYNQRFERLGRAVTPPLYKYVGQHIYKTVLKKFKNKK